MKQMGRVLLFLGILPLSQATLATQVHSASPSPQKAKASPKITEAERVQRQEKQHRQYFTSMEQELNRNVEQFKKLPHPKVYHLRYRLRLIRGISLVASDGDIITSQDNRKSPRCLIGVDVRVGDHNFDQTGQDGYDWRIYNTLIPNSVFSPKELTPVMLKKMFWKTTDYQYRIATAQYWRKSYVRSTKPRILDKAGDFSKESPTVYLAPLDPPISLDVKRWKGILQRVTAQSRHATRVIQAQATLKATEDVVLGVAMDGSKVRLRQYGYHWGINISYLGKNKEYVTGSATGYAQTAGGLPSEAELQRKFRQLWQKLKDKTAATEGDPDDGPAIVDPALAGAIFYDILMLRLETGRFLREHDERIFANKMNQLIIPSFLTVIDDPMLRSHNGIPLSSHFLFDDEWVPSQRLVMIKDGVLKNFYMSRKPYKEYKRSNGHGRAEFMQQAFSRPGTTIVQSKKELPAKELMAQLIAEAKRQGKQYGYILKRFEGYSHVNRSIYTVTPEQLFRVEVSTGRVEQIKGLRVRTAALQVIRGILATGNDYKVFNGTDGEDSGTIPIATIAPSLLIQRLVFDRTEPQEKLPFELAPPFTPITLQDIRPKPQQAPVCPKVCPEICRRCPACQPTK